MQAAGVAKPANRERATCEELNPLSSQGADVIGSNPNEFATLINENSAIRFGIARACTRRSV